MRLDLFIKLKYKSSTIILFIGVRYSMRDLLSDFTITLPDAQTNDMHQMYTVNDVSASSGVTSP